MPFSPSNSVLNTLNEFKNFSHTITYTAPLGSSGATGVGSSYPVTITAVEPHDQVVINDGTISGYYSNVFNNDIYYRTIYPDVTQDEFKKVNYFTDINPTIPYEIYHDDVDTTTRRVFTYIAEANGETKTYTINVDNNWSTAHDQLLLYLTPQQTAGVLWINNISSTVTWKNASGSIVIWKNNT